VKEGFEMEREQKIKLWNKNFFLLWQGQLVSYLGDIIYSFALSFWVLQVTGSTALMGILSAVSMAPRLILGPFAGVFVDKWDRKKIIVITDLIRGILSTLIGIAAIMGFLEVWMMFIVGIANSICSAFFNPAVIAVKPDLVHRSKLSKANSVTSFAESGASMIGGAISGVVYIAIGAPYMFLFNGISYLFSSFTELFINISDDKREIKEITFKEDFKEGLSFIWNFKTLRYMFMGSCCINFFCNAAFILLLPLFNEASFLGAERYGIAMGMSSFGMLIGSGLLSIINVPHNKKYLVSLFSLIFMGGLWLLIPVSNNFYIIIFALSVAQCLNMVSNTIINTMNMTIVPENKRGKVFALFNTLSMGLTPLGSCVGGILGEIFSIRVAMFGLLSIVFMGCIAIPCIKGLKTMISFNPENETIDELIRRTNEEVKGVANLS
jgi:DHA3 family macrolide efflux protein-like MFS transporter